MNYHRKSILWPNLHPNPNYTLCPNIYMTTFTLYMLKPQHKGTTYSTPQ